MTVPALLLDLDGVVMRHRPALRRVSERSAAFVARHLKVPIAAAADINRVLYTNWGHTCIGLDRVYGSPTACMRDFNRYVYTRETFDVLAASRHDVETRAVGAELRALASRCRTEGIRTFVFSNAPVEWCLVALDAMDALDGTDGLCARDVLGSDHPVMTQTGLKPDPRVYDAVAALLRHDSRDQDMGIAFVDDTMRNLLPVIGRPDWAPILFATPGDPDIQTPRLRTVTSLAQVADLVLPE